MLTAKYEKFEMVMKGDQYLAEMLFKYDKNLGHIATFDKKGRDLLHSLATLLNDSDDMAKDMPNISLIYNQLDEISQKLEKLSHN